MPYREGLVITDVAETHARFNKVINKLGAIAAGGGARRRGGRGRYAGGSTAAREAAFMREQVLLAYAQFNQNLDRVALGSAAYATKAARGILAKKRARPETGVGPTVSDAIQSDPIRGPLATGAVGIGDISRLDQVVNPFNPGAGPYWRTVEQGSTRHVGRQIYGFFFGTGLSGDPSPPQAQYGGGGGPHPVFVTNRQQAGAYGDVGFGGGAGVRGGFGGKGTIRSPIKPIGFLKGGAALAEASWRAGIARTERQAIAQLGGALRIGQAATERNRRQQRAARLQGRR